MRNNQFGSQYPQQSQTTNRTLGAPGTNGVGCTMFILCLVIGVVGSVLLIRPPVEGVQPITFWLTGFIPAVVGLVLGYLLYMSLRIARQWEKAVILRLGKFSHISGPGIFFLWPFDNISSMVDTRVQITSFKAEQTLSRDTVPVDVDAVLFWFVWDVSKASLAVSDYAEAVSWAAQTALRDTIGKSDLASLLAGRSQIEFELKRIIDERTEPWGITVQSVEMRDVLIPEALQDAMSKEAQAQRERHARVILSQAEVEVAQKFDEAAQIYITNPAAMQLRSMNLLADAIRERGALVIVPNSAVETLGMGTISGLAGLSQEMLPGAPRVQPREPNKNGNPQSPQQQPTQQPQRGPNQNNLNMPTTQYIPPQNPQQPGNPQNYSPWPQGPQSGQGGPPPRP